MPASTLNRPATTHRHLASQFRVRWQAAARRVRDGYGAAAHGRSGLLLVFVLGTSLAAVNSAIRGFPPPAVHDELSYMLGADTFAHGRLTNPTHPMWRYFETFHVIQRPSYASKYPPAQALMLAAGQVWTGHPIVAVWLSFGAMCAALLWMLSAWTRPTWALGAIVASAFSVAATYWAYGYWGGTIPAIGGAFIYGASRRVVDRGGSSLGLSVLLGVGLLLLANSRPYEGLLASMPVVAILAVWLFRSGRSRAERALRLLLPVGFLLAIGAVLMGAYNAAVTGHWYEMPYVVYQRQYDPVPLFIFQGPITGTPPPPNLEFAKDIAWQYTFVRPLSIGAYLQHCAVIAVFVARFFLTPALLWLTFAALPFAVRDRWTAIALVSVLFVALGLGFSTYFGWHYAAPIAACYLAIWTECLRSIASIRVRCIPVGRWIAVAAVWLLATWGMYASATFRSAPQGSRTGVGPHWAVVKRDLQRSLQRRGGKHLVLVTYGSAHSPLEEWVYNGAEIDSQQVVWARDLGPGQNGPIIRYYRDRTPWSLILTSDSTRALLSGIPTDSAAAVQGRPLQVPALPRLQSH